jgi:hypothetical protein
VRRGPEERREELRALCVGGECTNGRCSPALLATGIDRPWYIALGTDAVFVISADPTSDAGMVSKILRIEKSDGRQTVLYEDAVEHPFDLKVHEGFVYFTVPRRPSGPAMLRRVAVDGGPITTLATFSGAEASELCIVGQTIYVTAWTDSVVHAVPLGGGTPVSITGQLFQAEGIATDGQFVYVTSVYAAGDYRDHVTRIAPAEGNATTEIATAFGGRRLAAAGQRLYMVGFNPEVGVMSLSPPGAPVIRQLTDLPRGNVGGVVADANDVYFAHSLGGIIYRAPPDVASLEETFTKTAHPAFVDAPVGLAMDERVLYWTDQGKGGVFRVAR